MQHRLIKYPFGLQDAKNSETINFLESEADIVKLLVVTEQESNDIHSILMSQSRQKQQI